MKDLGLQRPDWIVNLPKECSGVRFHDLKPIFQIGILKVRASLKVESAASFTVTQESSKSCIQTRLPTGNCVQ